jgi:hypothetical protein
MPNLKKRRSLSAGSRRGQILRSSAKKTEAPKTNPGQSAKSRAPAGKTPALKKQARATMKAKQTSRGGGLVSAFVDDKGFVSVDRVAERFGMSKIQLAETIGVKRETVYRTARLEAPKTQARATEMLEIVGRIIDWAGGERQAMAWYRAEPIAAFGGRTAESLVKEGKASAVRDYLDHVATGGFA